LLTYSEFEINSNLNKPPNIYTFNNTANNLCETSGSDCKQNYSY